MPLLLVFTPFQAINFCSKFIIAPPTPPPHLQIQSCFSSPTNSPADDSCQLLSDSNTIVQLYDTSEDYWACICGTTGCNNASVISSLDVTKLNVERSRSTTEEAWPMLTGGVNSVTEPETEGEPLPITSSKNQVMSALQKQQAFNNGLCKRRVVMIFPATPHSSFERKRERERERERERWIMSQSFNSRKSSIICKSS